jgi:hypothetical protein
MDVMCELSHTNRELLRANMDLHKRDRPRYDASLNASLTAANESMRLQTLDLARARADNLRADTDSIRAETRRCELAEAHAKITGTPKASSSASPISAA